MRSVGIKRLKSKLSEYVRAAAAGETVLVTDRDRVVAELVPPRTQKTLTDEELLAEGVREGWFTAATIPYTQPAPERSPDEKGLVPFEQLMADLARDREDR